MLALIAVAGLAWGFARVLNAPRRVEQAIPFIAIALALLAVLILPDGNALRDSVLSGARTLAILGLIALPIAAYFLGVGRLRDRAQGSSRARSGTRISDRIVRIDDDAALRAELAASNTPQAKPAFSLIQRDTDGVLVLVALVDRQADRLILTHIEGGDDATLPNLARALIEVSHADGAVQVLAVTSRDDVLEAFAQEGYHRSGQVTLAGHPDLVTLVWTAP